MSYQLPGPLQRARDLWDRVRDGMAGTTHRLWPQDADEEDLADVEVAVKEALRPVRPASDFRQSLRSSLDCAEHARREGIVVSDPPPYREGILLGLVATVVGVAGLLGWLVWRWRTRQRSFS
ncbi:MAG: hypothetical protein ACP5G7_03460 [Anaerolineae bacterium]